MTYEVSVTVSHPAHAPYSARREGPESHSLRSISDTLLQAVSDAQRHLGVEKTAMAELVASRGTFQALTDLLDEFGVGASPDEGMLGITQRVRMLGDEVRRLRLNADAVTTVVPEYQRIVRTLERQRNAAHEKISHHGEVINGVRRALNVSPETPDAELPRMVGELEYQHDQVAASLRRTVETIREVRAALKVGPETRDQQLGKIAELEHETLEMLDRDLSEQGLVARGTQNVAASVGVKWGMWLTSRGNTATPEQLAYAMFAADWREVYDRGEVGMITAEGVNRPEDIERTIAEMWDPEGSENHHRLVERARKILDALIVVPSTSLLPVTPEELARAIHEAMGQESLGSDGELVWVPWEEARSFMNRRRVRVAELALDRLPSFAAPKQPSLQVTPVQLARAMHEARSALTNAGGLPRPALFAPIPWEQQGSRAQQWFTGVAELALSELPEIARADAEEHERFAAHVDASLAEARRENALALEAFRKIAGLTGMSFGAADDAGALGMLAAEAVAQLKRERDELLVAGNDANSEMHSYRGMVMFVADMMGMSAEVVDDPAKFGRALRAALESSTVLPGTRALMAALEETRGLHGFTPFGPGSVTEQAAVTIRQLLELLSREKARPSARGDWMVRLIRMDGTAEGLLSATARHGNRVLLNGAEYRVELHLTGSGMPGLDFTSVTAEQLGRAWFEAQIGFSPANQGNWSRLSRDVQESFVFHACRVIESLMASEWSSLTRHLRKPGTFFTRDASGEVLQGKTFKVDSAPQGSFRIQVPDEAIKAAFDAGPVAADPAADLVAQVISGMSGGKIMAKSGADRDAVLTQLREQGEALRHWERWADRARGHHKLIAEALGVDEFDSPTRLAERAEELRAEVSRLQIVHDDFRRDVSVALRCAPMSPDNLLLSKARNAVDVTWAHQFCGPDARGSAAAKGLVREMAVALGLEPSPQGGEWPWVHLLSRVAELVRNEQNVVSVSRDHHAELRSALGVDGGGWSELMGIVSERTRALAGLRETLHVPAGESELMIAVKVVELMREKGDRAQDLSRALGFNSGESWEDMIEFVTGRTSDHGAVMLERNALLEIRRILGLNERLFPAGVVDAVRSAAEHSEEADKCRRMVIEMRDALKLPLSTEPVFVLRAVKELRDFRETAIAPFLAGDLGRMSDAVMALVEAAGIAVDGSMPNDVVVGKAGDAAAILRSWPDVLRGVDAFEGVEVEQPDEVEPLLRSYAEVFYKADRRGSVTRAIERLLAAHRGEPLRDNLDTMYERLDNLISNLFEPLREVGQHYGVKAADHVDKQRFAEHVLLAVRKADKALAAAADPEMARLIREAEAVEQEKAVRETDLIRVTPRMSQEWSYGPTAYDSDSGKRWHTGCGGEVLTFDGVDSCMDCEYEWEPEAEVVADTDEPGQDSAS